MYDADREDEAEASACAPPPRENGAMAMGVVTRTPWAVLVCTGHGDPAAGFLDEHACLVREWGQLVLEPMCSAALIPLHALGLAHDTA